MAQKKTPNTYYNSVVRDALNEDPNSFAVLYASSYQDLYKKCFIALNNEYDVQDVMHDTYVIAYRRLTEIANPDNFPKWISIVCDSQISKKLKSKGYDDKRIRKAINGGKLVAKAKEMDPDSASQLLEAIFLTVDSEPNSVPLETLLSYHQYRSSKLILHRLIPIIALAALILVPFLFVSPTVTVKKNNSQSDPKRVYYDIEVSSLFPVGTVTATLSGSDVLVLQEGADTYSVMVEDNGPLVVTTTLINNRFSDVETAVTDIDKTPPKVDNFYLQDGNILLVVSDEGYGVDFEHVAVTRVSDNYISYPISYDKRGGTVLIPNFGVDAVLYIQDNAGNSTNYALTPRRS